MTKLEAIHPLELAELVNQSCVDALRDTVYISTHPGMQSIINPHFILNHNDLKKGTHPNASDGESQIIDHNTPHPLLHEERLQL